MVIDSYVSTRTTDSIEIRIISDKENEIPVSIHSKETTLLKAVSSYKEFRFFSYRVKGLSEGKKYTFLINDSRELKARTLTSPGGKRLFRFALLPDPHIAGPSTEKKLPRDRGPRLYSKAPELLQKYSEKAWNMGAEFGVLTGDIADPADKENMAIIARIQKGSSLPWYPLIGNHELQGAGELRLFTTSMGIPPEGYYAAEKKGRRMIFLAAPDQLSLAKGTDQYSWFQNELYTHRDKPCFIFCHYSIVLHPCVRGRKNDGMQVLLNFREIQKILRGFPNVKAWFAGHKNIPSVVNEGGVFHFLSPQLVQAPCGYDIVDVYENGIIRMFHEIDEQHYVWIARSNKTSSWKKRRGTEDARNVSLCFS